MPNQPHKPCNQPHTPNDKPHKPYNQPHEPNDKPLKPHEPNDKPHQHCQQVSENEPPQLAQQVSLHPESEQTRQPASTGESSQNNKLHEPDPPAEPHRICYTCAQSFPLTQFRFRNRTTGVRMRECRTCYNRRERNRHRKRRVSEKGWAIHKTASKIARSPDIGRTVALLEQLVNVMGGPQNLVEQWRAECWRLTKQKRSSTRLARMYEMLIVLMGQLRGA